MSKGVGRTGRETRGGVPLVVCGSLGLSVRLTHGDESTDGPRVLVPATQWGGTPSKEVAVVQVWEDLLGGKGEVYLGSPVFVFPLSLSGPFQTLVCLDLLFVFSSPSQLKGRVVTGDCVVCLRHVACVSRGRRDGGGATGRVCPERQGSGLTLVEFEGRGRETSVVFVSSSRFIDLSEG